MSSPEFPRFRLGCFPTPLHPLPRLSRELGGPSIWIKRDDLSGLALGGNKVRKLEFLVGEALASGCDTLVTGGATQSNHCRQTAAAAAAAGLSCHLVLGGERPPAATGNLLLDELLGAEFHFCGEHRKGEDIPAILEALRGRGLRPYAIPYGGSNAVGAMGFFEAMREFLAQARELGLTAPTLVFASSSGGTHAGLAAGALCLDASVRVHGIAIEKEEGEAGAAAIETLVDEVLRRRGAPRERPAMIWDEGFLGEGYGVVGDAEREALRLLARTEGILLDPVYTARAFAGLVARVREGHFGSERPVVFWHTGGHPALFAPGLGPLV